MRRGKCTSHMNFLAHAYLSGDQPDILIGNFIADHITGNDYNHYRKGIIQGIYLHRKIDSYTDRHPRFLSSKRRLHPNYHKYSGVIVDMFYDHFLAASWHSWSSCGLIEFTQRSYSVLMQNFNILPARTRRILPYMVEDNWLASYANLDFLQQSLQGIATRTPHRSGMEKAVRDLRAHYEIFHSEFRDFFPDLVTYAKKELEDLMKV